MNLRNKTENDHANTLHILLPKKKKRDNYERWNKSNSSQHKFSNKQQFKINLQSNTKLILHPKQEFTK